jgi:competence protein ComEC
MEAERGRFFLFLPACMAGGILLYFAQASEPGLLAPAIVTVVTLAGAVWARQRPIACAVLVALGFAAGGFARARIETMRMPPWPALPRSAVVVRGVVTRVEELPDGRRVTLGAPSLDGGADIGRAVRLRLRDTDVADVAPGDRMSVRALLRPPSPPSYPGGWDTQRDAFFGGMAGYGFALRPTDIAAGNSFSWLQTLRQRIAGRMMVGLPGARGAIAATLFTGLGAAIPLPDRAAFQASGLSHLLAVAGLHIGIVMGVVFAVMRTVMAASEYAALHWPVKRIAALSALAAGLLYLALTGGHVPILRSFAMACLVTLALLTGRRALSVRALALAALVLMAFAPELVVGVSFQMSFAAVLALVAGWEALSPIFRTVGLGRWWRMPLLYGGGLAATSTLAGTASLPYVAYHFGTVPLFYVPANMLAVPLTALWVMPWGIGALLLMPFHLEHVCLLPMGWGIGGLLCIAHTVAAWPAAIWVVPQTPVWGLLLVSAGMVWFCLWRTWLRFAGLCLLATGVASPWLASQPDVVVSADARVIAVRAKGQVLEYSASGADRFARALPARVWGQTRVTDLPNPAIAVCGTGSCRFSLPRGTVLLVIDAAVPCDGAALVVSPLPLRGRCNAATVVDRFSVLDDGATSVTFIATGAVKVTDRVVRGDRPWVISGRVPIAASRLPPATTE